jgi:hypothetical protein
MTALNEHETKVLKFLAKKGKARYDAVVDALADKDSKTAKGQAQGSNGAKPMIFGWWTRNLKARKFIKKVQDQKGQYMHHEITEAGRKALAKA